jgi:hypothetical protein
MKQKKGLCPKRRRRVSSYRWKLVDDKIITECLREARVPLEPAAAQGLRAGINSILSQWNRLREEPRQSDLADTPHERFDQLNQLLALLKKLRTALRREATELAYEADKLANHPHRAPLSAQELRDRFPTASDLEIATFAGSGALVLPSIAATNEVKLASAAVRLLEQLTEARRRIYLAQKNESSRKEPDLQRYTLVLVLASVFRKWTRLQTTTTVDRHWIPFLARLLNRCEHRKDDLSPEGARKVWKEARDWYRAAPQRAA